MLPIPQRIRRSSHVEPSITGPLNRKAPWKRFRTPINATSILLELSSSPFSQAFFPMPSRRNPNTAPIWSSCSVSNQKNFGSNIGDIKDTPTSLVKKSKGSSIRWLNLIQPTDIPLPMWLRMNGLKAKPIPRKSLKSAILTKPSKAKPSLIETEEAELSKGQVHRS